MTPKEKTPKEAEKLPLRLFLLGRYTKEQVIEIFERSEKRRTKTHE